MKKDAIHQPVITCTVGRRLGLSAGDKVIISNDGYCTAYKWDPEEGSPYSGVVDPFIEEDVAYGEPVRIFIAPGLVTDLTHSFTTPWDTDTTDITQEYYDECRGCD